MTPNNSGCLSDAAAQLERARCLMERSPDDYQSFAVCLEAATAQVRQVSVCSREELSRFCEDLGRLTTLFHGAESFYKGWCGLAGISEGEPVAPTICIQA